LFSELTVADRRQKKEIRLLEQELPKWHVLVEHVTGDNDLSHCFTTFTLVITECSIVGTPITLT